MEVLMTGSVQPQTVPTLVPKAMTPVGTQSGQRLLDRVYQ